MTRYHATKDGNVPFTAQEELDRDVEDKTWSDEALSREMASIRQRRDALLRETDYFGLSDVTLTDDMKAYRQALRDIPASNTVYDDVDWGTKP